MDTIKTEPSNQMSKAEELANSLSHGFGLLASFVGAPLLIIHAVQQEDVGYIVGSSIFAATVILLYFFSTLYHGLPDGKPKRVFLIMDHMGIFLLIAGTYTPFTLGVLNGAWGWSIFGVIWGLAALGMLLKLLERTPRPHFFTALYLLMGWVMIAAVNPMLENVATAGLLWLLVGGLFYSFGVIFFVLDHRLKFGHMIWHFFVIAGTTSHYIAVYGYAYPA